MKGVAKIIDELGLMLISKDAEIRTQREEIDRLKRQIELIEQYLDAYALQN